MRVKLILILLILMHGNVFGQTNKFENILLNYQDTGNFKLKLSMEYFEVGNIFSEATRHAIIFKEVDSISHVNTLELITLSKDQNEKKRIDSIEMNLLTDLSIKDFNADGYNDLMITIIPNKPINLLYLYDTEKDSLRPIPEIKRYPELTQTSDHRYFYSYKATGCADNIWQSSLITIEHFEVIHLADILTNDCDPNHSIVLKTEGENTLMLPSYILEDFTNGKFEFIEKYWESKLKEWTTK